MNPKELRNFQEAYFDIYEQDEILDEAEVMKHQAQRDRIEKSKSSEDDRIEKARSKYGKERRYFPPTKGVHGEIERRQAQKPPSKLRSGSLPESYDLYDIILSHLIDEGYADTEDAAEAIMVNMSEEWKEDIIVEAGKNDARIRGNIKSFGSNYTPPRDWDQSANRGQGAVLNAKQKEKQRRKGLRQEEYKESFNVFVNSMIAEGVSMESYTWKEIQNVFDDIFEAQVANRNPDEYERKAKQGQSREQQLKGKVMGRMSQMDPEKRKKMLAQMRAVGLDV